MKTTVFRIWKCFRDGPFLFYFVFTLLRGGSLSNFSSQNFLRYLMLCFEFPFTSWKVRSFLFFGGEGWGRGEWGTSRLVKWDGLFLRLNYLAMEKDCVKARVVRISGIYYAQYSMQLYSTCILRVMCCENWNNLVGKQGFDGKDERQLNARFFQHSVSWLSWNAWSSFSFFRQKYARVVLYV